MADRRSGRDGRTARQPRRNAEDRPTEHRAQSRRARHGRCGAPAPQEKEVGCSHNENDIPVIYTTGGDALSARDLGLTSIQHITIIAMLGTRMVLPVFAGNDTPETSVKILIASIAGVEVANASDQSALKFRFRATGLY